MAPKRPAAATASGSASEASGAEADASRHVSSPSPSKTPPPNPNPKSASAAPAPAAEDSAANGSDSGAAYDSDADHRPAPPKPAASPSRRVARRSPKPRSRSPSPEANSDSDGSAAPAASDADPAAGDGADSDDGNASPLPPPSRADAAAIKPLSSRPMDPPRRSVPSFSEPRPKRPRSAAIPAAVEQLKRPSRLWSPGDELVILRGLAAYRAKRGVLPGSVHDIGKLHGHIGNELSVKVTTTQLSDKVRRLKQKYHLLASRTKNGRDPDFPTPQDHSVYELGKKVWGASAGSGGGSAIVEYENSGGGDSDEERQSGESDEDMDTVRDDRDRKNKRFKPIAMSNGNGTRFGVVSASRRGKVESEKVKDTYPYLWETVEDLSRQHPNGVAFKKAFEMIEGPKARGIEEKLRKFRVAEVRHQLRRMELMKETVKMVLDALEG